jgi:putative membrane protein
MKAQAFPWLLLSSLFAVSPTLCASADSAVSSKDREFMEKAARAGHAEVAAGKLASSKASNDQVKQFGERMVQDHGKAGEELKNIALGKGVTLPSGPDAAHKKLASKLESSKGADFDRLYVAEAGVKDHKEAVELFTDQAKNGKDADLKAFAQKTLPTIREHYQMAQDLNKAVKK